MHGISTDSYTLASEKLIIISLLIGIIPSSKYRRLTLLLLRNPLIIACSCSWNLATIISSLSVHGEQLVIRLEVIFEIFIAEMAEIDS